MNATGERHYQSRFRRDPLRHTTMQIYERDLEILAITYEHQFLTLDEIRQLCFSIENGYKAAARRLQMLWNAGFLSRQYVPTLFGSSPAVYSPTPAGIELLVEGQRLTDEEMTWRAKHNQAEADTIRHELTTNKLLTQLAVAIAEHHEMWRYEIHPSRMGGKCRIKRIDMPKLREIFSVERGSSLWDTVENPEATDKARQPFLPIRPDRLIVMKVNDSWKAFFLEVEIASKSQSRFRQRIRAYRTYYQSGGFLQRYGEGNDPARYPFNVLITVPTEERRNNLIELAIRERALKMCLFAVYDEVLADPFGKVWVRGEEYQAALSQLSQNELTRMYQTHRHCERDEVVRDTVPQFSLLEL